MNASAAHHAPPAVLRPDPAGAHQPFALTDIQHAYWIGRSGALDLGNVACHAYFEWCLAALDIFRLEAAWNRIVARHGMLRAIVLPSGEQQILAEVPHYAPPVEDLSDLPEAVRADRLETIRATLQHRVADASRWPLFAVQVTRLGPAELRLHIDLDLLTVDVQSFHIILGELERLYADPAAPLAPLSITFRDYVRGREALGAARREADRAWWQARLPSLPAAPQLPLARAPQDIVAPDFVLRHATLAPAEWRRFEAFAQARNLTGSGALLAAYAEVLGQWSREEAFCLNLTHFHRERLHPEVDGLVGDFTSVVIVPRAASEPGSAFAARARALQKETWVALSHRAFSGIEVMRALGRREGSLRGAPMPVVFTSLLGLDIDALASPGAGPALLPEPEIVHTATPQVWFDHQVMVRHGALHYNWITIDALFPEGMVAAMFEAYGALLHRLAAMEAAWDTPPPALLPAAQHEARARANATTQEIAPRRLQDGFRAGANAAPDRPALIASEGIWSYGRLAAEASAVALRLEAEGVAEGDRIVVCLPRGCGQIAAVLGALDAGAAYVPVPAETPAARLALILEDTAAAALITMREDVPWPVRLHPGPPATRMPHHVPRGAPANLAYIIYTSGSTGRPKGVATRHAAAWNTIADINRRLDLGPEDRVLGVSSLGFDLSVQDIFGTLAAGGALVLCDEALRHDPRHWLDLVRRHRVSVWNSVPALLELLLDEAAGGGLPLRAAMLSGDWVPLGLPERLRAAAPAARFLALGGATEASIWSNVIEVGHPPAHWRSIPYGFPLANQFFRVLDREGRDRPDWVAGDLHIGGAGLAEGYWNNEALTKAAFIRGADGARLYRTGDRGRYWPDGTLEFLGREDTQVKIAGHRIELGEIEAVLAAAPGIRDAVAIVTGGPDGARGIAAFAIEAPPPPGSPRPDLEAIRRAAAAAETAVPAATLDRVRAVQAAADAVARIAIARTLAAIDAGTLAPDPRFTGLVRQWRGLGARDGDLDAAIGALCALPTWPGGELLTGWIAACAASAGDLVAGRRAPLELLFPGATVETATSLYLRNPAAEGLSAVATAMLRAAPRRADMAVLEVGGGVGAATSPLLPVIEETGCRYVFTDVSLFFLDAARDRFGKVPGFTTARFDINREPAGQGLPIDRFDLIVAANVMHDAHDLPRSLSWLRELLAPGGRLMLIEATANTPVQMITGGFLEGFGAFADFRAAEGLPLIDVPAWRNALDQARFDLLHAAGEILGIGQHVLLAERRPGPEPQALQAHLAERLPAYMLPSSITLLDALPLGPNGKVDRRALAALRPAAALAAAGGRAPRGATETRLAAIWSELLALTSVSAETNFFRSGGDSLLAIRLVQRLRDAFGRDIPVRSIFEAPNLAALAERIEAAGVAAAQDRPLLLLFPGSDGAARVFAALEAALGTAAEIRVADPGRAGPDRFAAEPDAAAEAVAAPLLHDLGPGRPLLLGGWSSGAVLAAALAARRARTGLPVAGLVLLDPVDWRAHAAFAARAAALGHEAPPWLARIVEGQIGALAAFRPVPVTCPALCLWAARREAGWPVPEPAWAEILPARAEALAIDADHWGLLREPAAPAVARAIADFLVRIASRTPITEAAS